MSRRPGSVAAVVLVVLSVLAGPVAVTPARAGTLSDVHVTATPAGPATTATWTVNATADSDLGGQSLTGIRINTDAAGDPEFSNVSRADIVRTTIAGEPYNGSVSGVSTENNGETLVISYDGSGQGIETGDGIEVVFEDGVTPSAPGSYEFRIGVDGTSSGSANLTVEGPVTNRDTGEQFATIGGAVADADTDDGDTVAVAGGTYAERVRVNESVTLVATGDATLTGEAGTALTVTESDTTVRGFTVRGGETGVAVGAADVQLTELTVARTGTAVRITEGDGTSLTDSVLRSNDRGVAVSEDAGRSTIRGTEFLGNGIGVANDGGAIVDARRNWWGAPSGPGGEGPGTGDPVRGDVRYDPWLQPDVAVEPAAVAFGNVTVGDRERETIRVRNRGNRTLSVDGALLRGQNASQYALVDGGDGATLDPGESRAVAVAFAPERAGPLDAELAIRSDDPESPSTVALTGTGESTGNETTTTNDSAGNETSATNDSDGTTSTNESTGEDEETGDAEDGQADDGGETSVRVDRTDETGPTRSVNVTVRDADALETVSVNTSVGTAASNVTVEQVNVTPSRAGNFSLNVTVSPERLSTTPEFTPDSVDAVGYVNVSHDISDADITQVSFRHRVPKRTLNESGVPPDEVALYRYHDGSWNALNTTLVNETADAYVYRTISPGLSEFGEGVQYPDISIAQATVSVRQVSIDEEIRVPVRVTNEGPADGAYTARLLVNGSSVAARDLTVPANGTRQVTFQRTFDRTARYTVEVNNVSAGTVVVYDPQQGTPSATPTPVPSTGTTTPTATASPTARRGGSATPGGGLVAGVGAVPIAVVGGGAIAALLLVAVGRSLGPE
jgi:PGF-pre-PGF domain-containing protein